MKLSKLKGMKGMDLTLDGIVLMVVVSIILLAVSALILAGIDDATDDANASAIAQTGLTILEDILGWIPLLVIVLIAVIILFYIKFFRGSGEGSLGGR